MEHSGYNRFDTLREQVVGRAAAPISPGHHVIARFSAMLLFVWPWPHQWTVVVLLSGITVTAILIAVRKSISARRLNLELVSANEKLQLLPQEVKTRARLEESLRDAQKLEAVGKLAGGVAHDFNNLLTIINGYSHMMLDSLSQHDAFRSHIEEILKAGSRAAALSTQLLAFSRRRTVAPQPLDLNHAITNLEKLLRRVIGEDIVFNIRLYPQLPRILADSNQIDQVLINLVANARDAMRQGGTLRIETSRVEIHTRPSKAKDLAPGTYVRLTVVDTGHGMDAETKARLFERFFTTKLSGKGTGLGMATVAEILRENQGTITVVSEPGQGAEFSIFFPGLAVGESCEAVEQESGHLLKGDETILLVEDEALLRQMLVQTLTRAGYFVIEAGDGSEALCKWRQERTAIDLVLTDVVMPIASGVELARQITAESPSTRIIFMSGHTDEVIAYHGVAASGTTILQKPFVRPALLKKIREVLDAGGQDAKRVRSAPLYQRAPGL